MRPEEERLLERLIEEKMYLWNPTTPQEEMRIRSRLRSFWIRLRKLGLEPDEVYAILYKYFEPDKDWEEFVNVLRESEEIEGLIISEKIGETRYRETYAEKFGRELIEKRFSELADTITFLMEKYGLPESLAYAVAVGDMELTDAIREAMKEVSICDVHVELPLNPEDVEFDEDIYSKVLDILEGRKPNCVGIQANFLKNAPYRVIWSDEYRLEDVITTHYCSLGEFRAQFICYNYEVCISRDEVLQAYRDLGIVKKTKKTLIILTRGKESYALVPVNLKYFVIAIPNYDYEQIPFRRMIADVLTEMKKPPKPKPIEVLPPEIEKVRPPIPVREEKKKKEVEVEMPTPKYTKEQIMEILRKNYHLDVLDVKFLDLPSFGPDTPVAYVIDETDKSIVPIIIGWPKKPGPEYMPYFIRNKMGDLIQVNVLREEVLQAIPLAEMLKEIPTQAFAVVKIPEKDKPMIVNELRDMLTLTKQLELAINMRDFEAFRTTLDSIERRKIFVMSKLAEYSYKLRSIFKSLPKAQEIKEKEKPIMYPDLWKWFSKELKKKGIEPEKYVSRFNYIVSVVSAAGKEEVRKELKAEIERIEAEEELAKIIRKKEEEIEKKTRYKIPKKTRILRYGIASLYMNIRGALISAESGNAEDTFMYLLRANEDIDKIEKILGK